MRISRPVVAAAALLLVGPLAASVSAATNTSTPAAGQASSGLTLVKVASGAAWAQVGSVTSTTSTTSSSPLATITIVPAATSQTGAIGKTVITSGQTKNVPGVNVSVPISGVGSISGPTLVAKATSAPLTQVTASALGSISVLGHALSLGVASLSDVSKVTSTAATATKSLNVNNIALPTLANLLAGLGLDLSKLNVSQLTGLSGVVGQTFSTLVSQINSLNSTLGTSINTVAGAQSEVTSATAAVNSATSAFDSAFGALNLTTINTALAAASLPTIPSGTPLDYATWSNLSSTQQTVIDALTSADLAALATAVSTAQATLTTATTLLNDLLSLVSQVTSALNQNPLAALGGVHFATTAIAQSTPAATATATIGSLSILGLTQSVSSLASALAAKVNQVASVLNAITGVTFTPPTIALGSVTKKTGTSGLFKTASASVAGLVINMPRLTLPSALALPGAASLPGVTQTASGFSTVPASVTLGDLVEQAQWKPGTSVPQSPGTPPSVSHPGSGPSLASTGAPTGIAVLALIFTGLALAMRRRARSEI